LVNFDQFDANGRYKGTQPAMKVKTVGNEQVGIITKETVTS
jgi:hypothetical protein